MTKTRLALLLAAALCRAQAASAREAGAAVPSPRPRLGIIFEDARGNAEFLRSAGEFEAPVIAGAVAQDPPPAAASAFPPSFSMFETNRGMLPGTEFKLRSLNGGDLGRLYPRIVSVRRSLSELLGMRPRLSIIIEDAHGAKVAEGTAQFFSLAYVVRVEDAQGRLIGSYSGLYTQELADRWFFDGQLHNYYTRYDIHGPDGALTAVCEKTQNPAIKFTVKRRLEDMDSQVLAEIRSANGWAFDIHHPEAVDARVLVMIPAFKSYVEKDAWKREFKVGR